MEYPYQCNFQKKTLIIFIYHHVLHSLSIAKFIQFKVGSNILDIGTGGGFPGVPLAMCSQSTIPFGRQYWKEN